MAKNKQRFNKQRQDFLLSFFPPDNEYQTREVNGYTLVKQFNKISNSWNVAIYTPGTYETSQLIFGSYFTKTGAGIEGNTSVSMESRTPTTSAGHE